MHALLGRAAGRRGERDAAVAHWRRAAAVAMEERLHLYALRVGQDCGGAEGAGMAEAACAAMGRAQGAVAAELERAAAGAASGASAPADQPWQLQVRVASAQPECGRAEPQTVAAGGASTPRRRLREAKAQDPTDPGGSRASRQFKKTTSW